MKTNSIVKKSTLTQTRKPDGSIVTMLLLSYAIEIIQFPADFLPNQEASNEVPVLR